jgi:streptogramin lyase
MRARAAVRSVAVVALTLAALTLHAPPAGAAVGSRVTSFSVGTTGVDNPAAIALGPDGRFWFTDLRLTQIGRLSTSGAFTSFDPEPDDVGGGGIVTGPDGNLWFTVGDRDEVSWIGRMTPAGALTVFTDPLGKVDGPGGITAGPDGNLWFTSYWNDRIGYITTSGDFLTFLGAGIDRPIGITAGADGNLWFTNEGNDTIGRITPAGDVTNFPDPAGHVDRPSAIATGEDGNVWFTSVENDRIGRITPDGVISTFADPLHRIDGSFGIAPGADGTMWFTSAWNHRVGQITLDGQITVYPGSIGFPAGLVGGPEGDMWVTGVDFAQVVRVQVCSQPRFSDVPFSSPFKLDICWMDGRGISNGYPGGTYHPTEAVSRQAMAAFMYRLAGEPDFVPSGATFSDVPVGTPFWVPIEWAAEEGIVTGSPDGTFRPGNPVTRGAMSAFMYRLAGSPAFTPPTLPTFADVPADHAFYLPIEWMLAEGLTKGFPGGIFNPKEPVTRQAMSAFLHRLALGPGVHVS